MPANEDIRLVQVATLLACQVTYWADRAQRARAIAEDKVWVEPDTRAFWAQSSRIAGEFVLPALAGMLAVAQDQDTHPTERTWALRTRLAQFAVQRQELALHIAMHRQQHIAAAKGAERRMLGAAHDVSAMHELVHAMRDAAGVSLVLDGFAAPDLLTDHFWTLLPLADWPAASLPQEVRADGHQP